MGYTYGVNGPNWSELPRKAWDVLNTLQDWTIFSYTEVQPPEDLDDTPCNGWKRTHFSFPVIAAVLAQHIEQPLRYTICGEEENDVVQVLIEPGRVEYTHWLDAEFIEDNEDGLPTIRYDPETDEPTEGSLYPKGTRVVEYEATWPVIFEVIRRSHRVNILPPLSKFSKMPSGMVGVNHKQRSISELEELLRPDSSRNRLGIGAGDIDGDALAGRFGITKFTPDAGTSFVASLQGMASRWSKCRASLTAVGIPAPESLAEWLHTLYYADDEGLIG